MFGTSRLLDRTGRNCQTFQDCQRHSQKGSQLNSQDYNMRTTKDEEPKQYVLNVENYSQTQ